MKNIRIHIAGENIYLDRNVYIDIILPFVPRKGEIVELKEDAINELEAKAKKSVGIACRYAPEYFYYHSHDLNPSEIKEEHLQDLNFSDCREVEDVVYIQGYDFVIVTLKSM